MSPSPIILEFHSGVVRFDASFNLFVVLTHSPDDPQPVLLDGSDGNEAPSSERRGRVVGSSAEGSGSISGVFPVSNDLPRGLVIEIRSYESVVLREDGAMVVTCSKCTELPDWFGEASQVLFRRDAERLRIWARSSFRDGFSADEMAQPATPAEPKKKASAKVNEPKEEAPTSPDPVPDKSTESSDKSTTSSSTTSSASASDPKSSSEPYRPERMPAGSYTSNRSGKSGGLGCGTLILGGLCLLSVLAMLG